MALNRRNLCGMYNCYAAYKSEIIIWCFTEPLPVPKKTTSKPKPVDANTGGTESGEDGCGTSSRGNKKSVIAAKITEVEKILKKLQDTHGNKYSIEQLNAWAHMLHVEKHTSYDCPPDLPYFRGNRRKYQSHDDDSTPPKKPLSSTSVATTSSPTRWVTLRTECIKSWHTLLERGAISQSDYDEILPLIMKDIHSYF